MMKPEGAIVVHAYNPFNTTDRSVTAVEDGTELRRMVPNHDGAMICTINGEPVAREDWDCVLEAGDVVVFQNLPAGGGGGSNPFQIILSIVLIVAGVFTYNPYLISAGIGLGVASLIPTPKVPLGQQAIASPSPTYSVALSGNSARLGEPIPVPYGRHIIFPDFAAQPYNEFQNNDAFYFALLCLGNTGDLIVESMQIDDTSLSSFEEVQTQLQGSSFNATQTLVSVSVVNAPEVANQTMESFRVVGPFAAVGPGITTSRLGIDVIMPKGLFFANDDGSMANKTITWKVETRQINDEGEPQAGWILLGSESYTTNTNTPQRLSYSYSVPSARYEVRVQRTDTRDDNTRAGHDIEWAGMRAYVDVVTALETSASYLALKIRATSQLSGSSQRKVSVIVRRKLPKWSPTGGWTAPVETRSIAWALADVLRNNVYGGAIPDNRIDLQTLYELDQVWTSRGDTFNGIIDKRMTLWQALTTIARAGRARPIMRGSVFTFIRDSQQTLPVALFNMRNIQSGTFALDYAMVTEDSPDAVELEFFNEATWATDTVTVPFPGVSSPVIISKGSLLGVTVRTQALREAAYSVGDAAYRRTTVRFTTEMEGFLPSFGDLIAVSHDVPRWGSSAEVEKTYMPRITITESLTWTNAQHYAMLANSKGDVFGPYRVQAGENPREVVFIDIPAGVDFYTGTEKERTRISIGQGVSFLKYCRVTSIAPKNTGEIAITAVVEDDRVHNSDTLYLPQFPSPRPGFFMASSTPNYNAATTAQKSGNGGWVAKSDGTVGNQSDAGYTYQ